MGKVEKMVPGGSLLSKWPPCPGVQGEPPVACRQLPSEFTQEAPSQDNCLGLTDTEPRLLGEFSGLVSCGGLTGVATGDASVGTLC